MNQPYSENEIAFIAGAFLFCCAALTVLLLIGLKRLLFGPVRRHIHARWARRVARTVASRTDFDTALAKLTKENGR